MSALVEDRFNYKTFSRDHSITSEQLHFTNFAITKDQLYQSLKVIETEHLVDLLHKTGIQDNMEAT